MTVGLVGSVIVHLGQSAGKRPNLGNYLAALTWRTKVRTTSAQRWKRFPNAACALKTSSTVLSKLFQFPFVHGSFQGFGGLGPTAGPDDHPARRSSRRAVSSGTAPALRRHSCRRAGQLQVERAECGEDWSDSGELLGAVVFGEQVRILKADRDEGASLTRPVLDTTSDNQRTEIVQLESCTGRSQLRSPLRCYQSIRCSSRFTTELSSASSPQKTRRSNVRWRALSALSYIEVGTHPGSELRACNTAPTELKRCLDTV